MAHLFRDGELDTDPTRDVAVPEIAPFAAIRFDPARIGGDLSPVLAPPYDVLDKADKNALLARSANNIVAIDLPHLPPKSAGPPEVYEESAKLLRGRLSDGTLLRERQPVLYLYHQRFEHAGRSHTRRMIVARVRLQPFSNGSVLPHEQTFGGPKEDRLALMKATKCQLSPIFGLYTDSDDLIGSALSSAASTTPDATGTLDGVENRLWIVTDARVTGAVVSAMADKRIYIADGHHRYGTALLYRDFVAGESGGSLSDDHPANFVMFVLASMEDPGCLILPYNRALGRIDVQTVLDAWSAGTEPVAGDEADLRVFDGQTGTETALRFTNREVLATLEPSQCQAWHELDYAYLHRYLIDELLTAKLGGNEPTIRYLKSAQEAIKSARDESGVALLTRATPMAQLRAVSEGGGLMPPKSTYFHPKLATGLTLNPLA